VPRYDALLTSRREVELGSMPIPAHSAVTAVAHGANIRMPNPIQIRNVSRVSTFMRLLAARGNLIGHYGKGISLDSDS
jgi:hypothetical protein